MRYVIGFLIAAVAAQALEDLRAAYSEQDEA
jgi:hypothetical protein